MNARLARLPPPALIAITVGITALPLIVAVAALAQRRWFPVLDLVMTEFRVRDVGTRQTPLIGLPGRIGDLPQQGSHPGPLSFWLLAPGYRLLGGSAWALEAATASIALVWIALATWIGHRRLGVAGTVMVAAVVAVSIRGFGLSVLTQPWNPYMPLLAWLVVLLATWSVLDRDHAMLVPLVLAASFTAQTHIPYLLMSGGLGLVATAVVVMRWWRARSRSDAPIDSGLDDERHASTAGSTVRSLWVTVAAFVMLWLGPIADQMRRDPGNVRELLDHFGSPSDEAIGFGAGIRLTLRHLDFVGGFAKLAIGQERFVQAGFDPDGPIWPGCVLLVIWLGAVAMAARLAHRPLMALHVTLLVTLALTTVSMSRIFGVRWYYLTLWAWITTTLIIVAVLWTAVAWLRERRPAIGDAFTTVRVVGSGVTLAVVTTISMIVLAPSTDHPEEYLGDTVAALVGPTADVLDPDGTYVVEFKDAYFFGSQAFGLVGELERAGFDVGMYEFWRVPITSSRTKAIGDVDAEIVFVTGGFIEEWRANPGVEEVAYTDPRTDAQRAEYDDLREALIIELRAQGLDDLLDSIDTNLFGLNIDQRLSPKAKSLSEQMKVLGVASAVFLAPPGTTQ